MAIRATTMRKKVRKHASSSVTGKDPYQRADYDVSRQPIQERTCTAWVLLPSQQFGVCVRGLCLLSQELIRVLFEES